VDVVLIKGRICYTLSQWHNYQSQGGFMRTYLISAIMIASSLYFGIVAQTAASDIVPADCELCIFEEGAGSE
jgi:hypothetical protein